MKKNFSPEAKEIKERILGLAEIFGINDLKKGGALAKKLGVHNSVIKRLMEETSLPAMENILKICLNARVSADYLLFGAHMDQVGEIQKHYFSQIQAQVDTEKISHLVKIVEEYLRQHRFQIAPERKGNLITKLYEYWLTEGIAPKEAEIKTFLRQV